MDFLAWLLRLVFFLLALWFALQNTVPVPLRLSPNHVWEQVPLVIVILVCFVAGALAGVLAMVPTVLRQRRRATQVTRPAPATAPAADVGAENLTELARRAGAVGGLEAETRAGRR